ncbi:MAG: hypothetical protein M1828_001143 [Chrysothrix sp. TS-e1954]|nr:MAG: hypothetical protein M1828_001143 [Chrysothrix sp. TS-e1954]
MTQQGAEAARIIKSFSNSANTYERRLGSATRAVARDIVAHLPPLPSAPTVLDNACGTGAFTAEIAKHLPAAHVHAVDNSSAMVELMKAHIAQNGWEGRVESRVVDGGALSFEDETFDLSVTNFGLFFFADPDAGAREVLRTLRRGGVAVATCWRFCGIFPLLYQVQEVLDPADKVVSLPGFERWAEEETMVSTLKRAGFRDVSLRQFETRLQWDSQEEMVQALSDNWRGISGDKWMDKSVEELKEATWEVLRERPDMFLKAGDGVIRAVEMISWTASGTK